MNPKSCGRISIPSPVNLAPRLEVIPISAMNDASFDQVKQRIRELLDELAAQQQAEEWKRSL